MTSCARSLLVLVTFVSLAGCRDHPAADDVGFVDPDAGSGGVVDADGGDVLDDADAGVDPPAPPPATPGPVTAAAETEPAESSDPDDPAIWVDPQDPSRSLVIGTDKRRGLRVFDLSGRLLAEYPDGGMNNVDLRGTMLAASNRTDDTVDFYRIDPATRTLARIGAVPAGLSVYGLCLHVRSPGELHVIVTSMDGGLVQLRVEFDDDDDDVSATELRRLQLPSQLEGCAADDALGQIYVGEEHVGVWRVPADPSTGTSAAVKIDEVGAGRLAADVEGLAIYARPDGTGYLLASSQGDSSYAVYRREGANEYLGRFHIAEGALDATSETDGIDVTSAALGPGFPDGLLVVQDDENEGGTRNFKLVRWGDVARALALPL